MRHTDVLIVGAGLAGSTAAAMLGRAGIDALVVDPHDVYPPELRCEKLDAGQIEILGRTGLADLVLPETVLASNLWVARFGRLIDNKPGLQRGIMYDRLVNTIRTAIPAAVPFVRGKVSAIATSADRQQVALLNGETISARLVVLANGLNLSLRESLGIVRKVISPAHSVTIGFDIRSAEKAGFDFPALAYYAESPKERAAYVTLFPVAGAMRANYIVYRPLTDPWFAKLRKTPREALIEAMPRLESVVGPFEVSSPVMVRPADLYVSEGHEQPGIVLVGDAFATSCPGGGTGSGKAFTDVERLCKVHIPRWLAGPGMGVEKITAFYADPVKQAYDAFSERAAFELKATSIDPGWRWASRRWAKFLARTAIGSVRRLWTGLRPAAPAPTGLASGSRSAVAR